MVSASDLPAGDPGRRDGTSWQPLHPRPILVVDDDASSRLLIDQFLQVIGLGNPRIQLSDGDEAIAELDRLAELGPEKLPALVLLDGQMPACSGTDVLRWMRQRPELAGVAVVILSGDDNATDVNLAYELGARSYLVKPVGFEALGAAVRELDLPWLLA